MKINPTLNIFSKNLKIGHLELIKEEKIPFGFSGCEVKNERTGEIYKFDNRQEAHKFMIFNSDPERRLDYDA